MDGLNFEDDRRWWWDDDIDAVRLAYETETVEIVVALARQLGTYRSDRNFTEPEDDRVLRVLGEASWDWHENHGVELFALYSDDHSPTPQPGELVRPDREDASDAQLTWIGGRAMGVFDLEDRGLLGYWLDAAWVWGDEWSLEFEEFAPGRSVVSSLTRRDIRGWAFDTGVNWLLPSLGSPVCSRASPSAPAMAVRRAVPTARFARAASRPTKRVSGASSAFPPTASSSTPSSRTSES